MIALEENSINIEKEKKIVPQSKFEPKTCVKSTLLYQPSYKAGPIRRGRLANKPQLDSDSFHMSKELVGGNRKDYLGVLGREQSAPSFMLL